MAAGGSSGGGMGQAILAGRAVVGTSCDLKGLESDLQKAKKMLVGWGKNVAVAGAAVTGLGAAIVGPILLGFHSAVEEITEVRKAAEQLGAGTEEVSALAYAAKKAGVDLDGFVTSSRHMQKVLSDAASGDKGAADALAKIGLNAKDLINLPLEDQYAAIADGIAGLATPADQAAAAMEIMGKAGAAMVPVLRKGSAGLAEMRKDAEDMGVIISQSDAEKAKDYTKAIGRAKLAVEEFWQEVGSSVLEIVGPLKEASAIFVSVVQGARKVVEVNRPAVLAVLGVGTALVAAGTAIVAFGGFLAAVGVAVGGFMTAIGAVGSVLAFVFSPVGLGIATLVVAGVVVAALVADFVDLKEAVAPLGEFFTGIGETFSATWTGIKDALASGDLSLALKVATAGADVVWKEFLLNFKAGWHDVWGDLEDVAERGVLAIKIGWRGALAGWRGVLAAMKGVFADFSKFIGNAFLDMIEGILKGLAAVVQGTFELKAAAVSALPGGKNAAASIRADGERAAAAVNGMLDIQGMRDRGNARTDALKQESADDLKRIKDKTEADIAGLKAAEELAEANRKAARQLQILADIAGLTTAKAALAALNDEALGKRMEADFLKAQQAEFDIETAMANEAARSSAMSAIANTYSSRGAFGAGNAAFRDFAAGSSSTQEKIEKNTRRAADAAEEANKKGGLEVE